jgi:Relaxase/Mobilisation nuclease domain
MIIKATPHNNGARLARYMRTGKEGERAEVWELSGFAADDIETAFRDVHVMAEATRCEQPFFHVQVRNREGETLTREQWKYVAERIESVMALKGQPRAIAFHIDERTGNEHMHVAWSRIDEETLKARPLPFYKLRLKRLARELEAELGLTPVTNERDGPIAFAPTRAEDEQARRLGVDIHATRNAIRSCYDSAECGHSFDDALAAEGLILAQGKRYDYIVVDHAGGIHALGKRLLGASTRDIREKLDDLDRDRLPTEEQARELMLDIPRDRMDRLQRELSAVEKHIAAEREYAARDPVREEMEWLDAVAQAAIEKEKIERAFVTPEDRKKAGSRRR